MSKTDIEQKIVKFISKYGTTDGETDIYYFKGENSMQYEGKRFDLLYMGVYEVCGAENKTYDKVPQFLMIEANNNGEDTYNEMFFDWAELSDELQNVVRSLLNKMGKKASISASKKADIELADFVCSQLEGRGLTFFTTTDGHKFAYLLASKREISLLEGIYVADYPLVAYEDEQSLKMALNTFPMFFTTNAIVDADEDEDNFYPSFSEVKK